MPDDYTTSELMADVMATVQETLPAVVKVALFLAVVNFLFGMLYFALDYLSRKPFR